LAATCQLSSESTVTSAQIPRFARDDTVPDAMKGGVYRAARV